MKFLFLLLFLLTHYSCVRAGAEIIQGNSAAATFPSGINVQSNATSNCTGTNAKLCAGQYTPTGTSGSCGSVTYTPASYARVGNYILISGYISANCANNSTVIFSLPFSNSGNFTDLMQAAGTVKTNPAGWGTVKATVSAQTLTVTNRSGGAVSGDYRFIVGYTTF